MDFPDSAPGGGLIDPRNYAEQGVSVGKQMTLKLRLEMAVQEAEKKLADAKRAREILNKNPDLEELLNIMNRTHF